MNRSAWLAGLLLAAVVHGAGAADLKMLSPGATSSSLKELIPRFERSSGHKVTVAFGPVGSLANRLKKGEAADVAVLGQPVADELRKEGLLVAGSETPIARVGVGVFVPKGGPKPDVSSVEAFLHAISTAKAISYSDPALGGSAAIYVGGLMDKLDVTGSIKAKTKLTPPSKPLADFVVSGGADFGLTQITEIFADDRLELVAPLPAPIQHYTNYIANLVPASPHQETGKALIAYLASPAAAAVMKSKGFE
jgi:molybdate transport system substrate-binding protein